MSTYQTLMRDFHNSINVSVATGIYPPHPQGFEEFLIDKINELELRLLNSENCDNPELNRDAA